MLKGKGHACNPERSVFSCCIWPEKSSNRWSLFSPSPPIFFASSSSSGGGETREGTKNKTRRKTKQEGGLFPPPPLSPHILYTIPLAAQPSSVYLSIHPFRNPFFTASSGLPPLLYMHGTKATDGILGAGWGILWQSRLWSQEKEGARAAPI